MESGAHNAIYFEACDSWWQRIWGLASNKHFFPFLSRFPPSGLTLYISELMLYCSGTWHYSLNMSGLGRTGEDGLCRRYTRSGAPWLDTCTANPG